MTGAKDLVFKSVLTHGGQSTVYEGRLGRQPVAIKVFEDEQTCLDEYGVIQQLEGVVGLLPLKIPQIVQLQLTGETSRQQTGSALVFDLLADDLYQFALSRKRPLAMSNVKELAKQMLETLAQMNARGLTHNDVKPENIMVVDNAHKIGPGKELILLKPNFKLIDLAYASKECIIAGTSTYYAPEQLSNQGGVVRQFGSVPRAVLDVGHKVDIWALGCVLVEMASGLRLFDFSNDTRRFAGIYCILNKIAPVPINEKVGEKINEYYQSRMQTTKDVKLVNQAISFLEALKVREPHFYALVTKMLQFNPRDRPSAT